MTKQAQIKAAFERLTDAIRAKPSIAMVTKETVCRVETGLKADCETAGFQFTVDVDKGMGGEGSAPNPGAYARGAVASCIAIAAAAIFARRDLKVDAITVRVEADLDVRSGSLALNDDPPGFRELRYTVEVDSPADPVEVRKVVEEATSRSPVLQSIARPIPVKGKIQIGCSGIAAAD
jgi:uncharacterized OsmC-like protein